MRTAYDRTALFDHWEKSLRGWETFGQPIELELSLVPCLKNHPDLLQQAHGPITDDGKHDTLLSRLAGAFSGNNQALTQSLPEEPEELEEPDKPEISFPAPQAAKTAEEI